MRTLAGLRSALYTVFLTITVIPWALLSTLCAPLPLSWRYRIITCWPAMALWGARWIVGIRYQILGADRLPTEPGSRLVILSKHQSAWETLYFMSQMPRDTVFVYKKELHRIPFFGWGLALLSMIPINRARSREAFEQVVSIGGQRLAEGRWPVLFPEGTRVAPGEIGRYKQGGAILACKTGTSVIPVAHNAGECWPRNSFIKTPGLVTLSFGPIIPSEGLRPAQLNAQVQEWIEGEMRRLNPERYDDPPTGTV